MKGGSQEFKTFESLKKYWDFLQQEDNEKYFKNFKRDKSWWYTKGNSLLLQLDNEQTVNTYDELKNLIQEKLPDAHNEIPEGITITFLPQ